MLFGDVGRSAVATSRRDRDLVSVRLKKAHTTNRQPPPPSQQAPQRHPNNSTDVDHDESKEDNHSANNNRASRNSWRQSSASLFRPSSLFISGNWQDAINLQDYLERDSIELELPELQQEVNEAAQQETAFIGENIQETYSLNKKWIQRMLRFVAFYAVGVYIFIRMEGWSLRDSIFFVTQTISTVGYGNITPKTKSGQMFTVFYLLIGILITFSVLGDVTHYIVKNMRKNYSLPRRLTKLQLIIRHVINCLMWIFIMFLLFISFALFFSYNENWSFEKALYFSVVTATSTGYGDIIPQNTISIWVNMAFILIGVSLTALAFEKISSFKRHLDCAELDQLLDAIELSPELLHAIDKTGRQRVSRAEYVLHMLQLAGKLGPGDILPWVQRFSEFDSDQDGILTHADYLESQAKRFSKAQQEEAQSDLTRVSGQSNRSTRKKSLIMIITDETKDVLMETLKLKKTNNDDHQEASKEVIIQSPLQSAKLLKRASNFCESSQQQAASVEMMEIKQTRDEEKGMEINDIYDGHDDNEDYQQRPITSQTVSRKVSFVASSSGGSSGSQTSSPQHNRSGRMNGVPPPPPPTPLATSQQQNQQQQQYQQPELQQSKQQPQPPRVSTLSSAAGAPPPPPPPPSPPQQPRVSISSSAMGAPPPPPPPSPSASSQHQQQQQQRRGTNAMHHRRSIDDL